MRKYLRVIAKLLPALIWAYFSWIFRYSRHPEKYDINLRFKKVQTLIRKVLRAFNVTVNEIDVDKYDLTLKEGKPHLIVANHISGFDPLIFIALAKRPITFVAKKEVLKLPFVGKVVKSLDGEFLDRDDLKQSLKVFKSIAQKMIDIPNLDWLIFPEGTRNKVDPTDTKPFHYGTFKPAMKNSLDVSVFSVLGTQRILNSKCKNKMNPVCLKYDLTYTFEDYDGLKTVDLSTKAYETCRSGVKSLIEEDKKLVLKYNKKA